MDGCSKSCKKHHPSATSQRDDRPFQMTMFDWKAAALKLGKRMDLRAECDSHAGLWNSLFQKWEKCNELRSHTIHIHIMLIYTLEVNDY